MTKQEWKNKTVVTEFILLGFGNGPELDSILFLMFLSIYIVTITGNVFIIVLMVANRQLHTPMYFFLGNLACLEICYSSNILPRMLLSYLGGDRSISVNRCFTQYYFFGCLAAAECYLLAVMSYDRYLAVCKPLHYPSRMNGKLCLQLGAASWINGFLSNSILTFLISNLDFCGPNEIEHFFCDSFPMIKLSCSDTHVVGLVTSVVAAVCSLPPFLLTFSSYLYIIITVMRIPSATGRKKAFSTCSSHLIVVILFYWSILTVYVLPHHDIQISPNKVFSVFYTILTPLVNPLIYSLRNKEVKEALRKQASKLLAFRGLLSVKKGGNNP
ncbi:LOW QUALITY PROTEIN: olfactory receptor 1020-like [Gymnogyps californianus]|uniref:LOW QUALITY PROTEIN: olfactory receptor 1020-like n=1 Tax=Gymnogyps californianus TaxID=33616 RepID=UPI0021CAC2F6|nr:LOW QUALITY PROTEIN: olfactory receptor 1020-like [Gymnogyps californianus]